MAIRILPIIGALIGLVLFLAGLTYLGAYEAHAFSESAKTLALLDGARALALPGGRARS